MKRIRGGAKGIPGGARRIRGGAKGVRGGAKGSLRVKLTLVNLALLLLGVVVAIACSLLAMRHYLHERVDRELLTSRDAIEDTGLTREQINSFHEMSALLQHVTGAEGPGSLLPVPETLLVALDAELRPTEFARHPPTGRQLGLAAAVRDPLGLAEGETTRDVEVAGDAYRVVAARLPDGSVLLLASDLEAVGSVVHQALRVDAAFGALLLALLALGTLTSTKHLVRPLEHMVETASAIAEGDLTRRVPAGRHPVNEIEQLRVALNAMLHQVESAFETRERSAAQLRRFAADASHELRTPLSAIRGYLQLYDRGMLAEPEDRARALARMQAETDRMARLVEELLLLARLDQRPPVRPGPVDLARLARDAAGDLAAQQPSRPVTVRATGETEVLGEEASLRQLVGNLLANARVHTPADTPVLVEAGRGPGGAVRLRVADRGPGMAPHDADRIFDRFFRAGTGTGGGSGLGMSVVRAAADAHGADVEVRTAPGDGLTVTVTFPEVSWSGASRSGAGSEAGPGPGAGPE
ncbi:ATP-binding protein [Streptomyces sp. NPDC058953]|uniref:sensor histidine kinase n=1 Tax=unclassified Streptomyces TaxID=2593676 RepID=UPI003692E2D5